ncbi:MAG TPA: hypothetical protein VHI10_19610 [Mycobacterium sp.]|nr:hypothetical protein [Mycobacterium sp.]
MDTVLREGLQRHGQGEKTDSASKEADNFLDSRLPSELASKGVGRQSVVYGYLSSDGKLVDIRSGAPIDIGDFASRRELTLLRMTVDSELCYVSDLNLYDRVKDAVQSAKPDEALDEYAEHYWANVVPLDTYEPGQHRRPEVLIAGDVRPDDIEVAWLNR